MPFISQLTNIAWWAAPGRRSWTIAPEEAVICTTALSHLKRAGHTLTVLSVPSTLDEFSLFERELWQLFLGMTQTYVLFFPEAAPAASKKKVLAFLEKYRGPHALTVFTEGDAGTATIAQMGELFGWERAVQVPDAHVFYTRTEAFLLAQHFALVPRRLLPEGEKLRAVLVEHHGSLSQLVENFLSGDKKLFYTNWRAVYDKYSEMFWVAFWGEVVWRMIGVIVAAQANDKAGIQACVGYKLPRDFGSRGWKKVDLSKLQKLHREIYLYDVKFKKSGLSSLIDLFMTPYGMVVPERT